MLYHITRRDNISDIMSNGLIPQIGDNAVIADEECDMIYLSDLDSLPYWYHLLGNHHPAVFQVDIDPDDTYSVKYEYYTEYQYLDRIPPERLQLAPDSLLQTALTHADESMKQLCLGYLYELSHTVFKFIRHYHDDGSDLNLFAATQYAKAALVILNRLDFTVCTTDEMKHRLHEIAGERCTTFLDRAFDYKYPIYEQLLYFPSDESWEAREQIYAFVVKNIPEEVLLHTFDNQSDYT